METSLKLELTLQSLGLVQAELVLSLGILFLIVSGLITKRFTIAKTVAVTIGLLNVALLLSYLSPTETTRLFNGMLIHDNFNFYLRITIALAGLTILLISQSRSITKYPAEYFTLVLTIILGGQLLVMSNHMVMVIISLELMSIPAYVVAGFAFTKESAEASMKYFIYGAVSTAFMIFGMSWLYQFGKGLELGSPVFIDMLGYNNNMVLLVACLFVIIGLLFKMAATPFHLWAPDVYQVTPYPTLALFSTVPKIAAGAVLLKAIGWFSLNGDSRYDWQIIASGLAIITLAVGNFSALWQKNVKRLMAYSSIGQAGFLMSAATIQTIDGKYFFLFYSIVLVISTVLVFLMLDHFQSQHKAIGVSEFAGLGKINPMPAILITIGLLSLTGLPITAGFTAKLFVFSGILEAWQVTGKPIMMALFAFGLINTVIALYYYLQVPYQMFLKENSSGQSIKLNLAETLIGLGMATALILLFVWPSLLIAR